MFATMNRYLMFLLAFNCFILAFYLPVATAQEEQEHPVFTTWEVFEVDKCASIWLITRFIDKEAVIKIIPRGEFAVVGTPFDMPEAKFSRTFNMSTYELFLTHYSLSDPKLIKIGKIVHDVEINTWDRKKYPESRKILGAINEIIMNSKDSVEIIEKSLRYFDEIYEAVEP